MKTIQCSANHFNYFFSRRRSTFHFTKLPKTQLRGQADSDHYVRKQTMCHNIASPAKITFLKLTVTAYCGVSKCIYPYKHQKYALKESCSRYITLLHRMETHALSYIWYCNITSQQGWKFLSSSSALRVHRGTLFYDWQQMSLTLLCKTMGCR